MGRLGRRVRGQERGGEGKAGQIRRGEAGFGQHNTGAYDMCCVVGSHYTRRYCTWQLMKARNAAGCEDGTVRRTEPTERRYCGS